MSSARRTGSGPERASTSRPCTSAPCRWRRRAPPCTSWAAPRRSGTPSWSRTLWAPSTRSSWRPGWPLRAHSRPSARLPLLLLCRAQVATALQRPRRTFGDLVVRQPRRTGRLDARPRRSKQALQCARRIRVEAPAEGPGAKAAAGRRDPSRAQAAVDVEELELDAEPADVQRGRPVRLRAARSA